MARKEVVPKQIFARIVEDGGRRYVEANEIADEFDEEGVVGRYELVEEGEITIENSFVPKEKREQRIERRGSRSGSDDRSRGS